MVQDQLKTTPNARSPAEALNITRGICHVLFAYEIGLSVDLNECDRRITAETQRTTIKHKRRAPSYFEYQIPPLRVVQQGEPITLGDYRTDSSVETLIYDFGAVSVSYRIPLEGPFDRLRTLSDDLYDNRQLLADARRSIERLFEIIRPAIVRPHLFDGVEDYVLFEIKSLDPPATAVDVRTDCGHEIARILRASEELLSADEINDAHACTISFGVEDLTVIDWHAAMIFDADPQDVRAVLEFANVELMEMRYLDQQLDKALDESYVALIRAKRRSTLFGGSAADLRHVAQLQVDGALLFEGVNNTLKLLGDQYLARVYRLASVRFHLNDWDASILRKLQTVDSIYHKMADRAATLRLEVLEWIIIALIAVSILISVAPIGLRH